jgi:hypothetical protein
MSNGYDGSMMNGLQTLENWRDYFDNPQGGLLGLFNAIQVSAHLTYVEKSAAVSDFASEYRYHCCSSFRSHVQRLPWPKVDLVYR